MTGISENEMNIQIPLSLKCPAFEWNLEDFFENLSEKDTLTEKKKKLKILGKQ